MQGQLIIREYANEYQSGVLQVILPIQQIEFAVAITKEDQPDLLNIQEVYQTGAGNFWVAVSESIVVGTIALLDIGQGQAALRKMFVAKDYRGKEWNTAAILLQTALEWAESKGTTDIYLGTTEKFKAAHRFYEKNKFREIKADELPAHFPRVHVDNKFYRLVLEQD